MDSPEITSSSLREKPLPDKPHLYLDRIWIYTLPKGMRWSYGNRAHRAYKFAVKLNKIRQSKPLGTA